MELDIWLAFGLRVGFVAWRFGGLLLLRTMGFLAISLEHPRQPNLINVQSVTGLM